MKNNETCIGCGTILESDGTCNGCGFDATEVDIY